MKTCYVIRDARAIADLIKPGELTKYWTITRINVPRQYRGQGYGTRLLEMILHDADNGEQGSITLALEVSPSDGLTHAELVAWYRRHGFAFNQLGYMIRRPPFVNPVDRKPLLP